MTQNDTVALGMSDPLDPQEPDDDTAAPVTEDELRAIELLERDLADGEEDAQEVFLIRARTLLPRLARDLRTIDTLIDEAGIGRRGPEDTIADRLRRLIADANEVETNRDALAEKIERMIEGRAEEHRLVTAHHQRAVDRVTELEADNARLRSLLAEVDKVKDERDRLRDQIARARKAALR